jgi:hypothetical protein
VDGIDPLTAQSLFDIWKIPEYYTNETLKAEFETRFTKPLCTGPGSFAFRYVFFFLGRVEGGGWRVEGGGGWRTEGGGWRAEEGGGQRAEGRSKE